MATLFRMQKSHIHALNSHTYAAIHSNVVWEYTHAWFDVDAYEFPIILVAFEFRLADSMQ